MELIVGRLHPCILLLLHISVGWGGGGGKEDDNGNHSCIKPYEYMTGRDSDESRLLVVM